MPLIARLRALDQRPMRSDPRFYATVYLCILGVGIAIIGALLLLPILLMLLLAIWGAIVALIAWVMWPVWTARRG